MNTRAVLGSPARAEWKWLAIAGRDSYTTHLPLGNAMDAQDNRWEGKIMQEYIRWEFKEVHDMCEGWPEKGGKRLC